MEKMPFREYLHPPKAPSIASLPTATPASWRKHLPVLTGEMVTLREIEVGDARSLLAMLSTEEVARYISPPPTTVEGFEHFIVWAQAQRELGEYVCFSVVPRGMSAAIGLFQVRRLDAGFENAEWGVALGSAYWGTGMFIDGGRLTIDFALTTLGVRRLEARAAVANGRGNGAMRKIGAVQEGLLRASFLRDGKYLDQLLWSILESDWLQAKAVWGPRVHVH